MKCKDCPVRGHTELEGFSNMNLCFCAGHRTTKIKPEDDCQYGIEDYMEYWKSLINKEKE